MLPKYWTEIHMNIYDFIYFLNKQYDTFKDNPYAFNRWQDALFDYLDISKTIPGESYILMKPDDLIPKIGLMNISPIYFMNIFQIRIGFI